MTLSRPSWIVLAAAFAAGVPAGGERGRPVAAARPLTYCNPLNLPSYPFVIPAGAEALEHRSMADPEVLKFDGRYYLFPSYGMAWVSDDLVQWEYHAVRLPPPVRETLWAPGLLLHRDRLYMSGNGVGLFRSAHPLGPWEYAGDVTDDAGRRVSWADPMFLLDDGKVYVYFNRGANDGVSVARLRADDLTRFDGPARRCFRFDPAHTWERWGGANEFTDLSWIEGAYATKHAGHYFLQYSAPGTEWKTYAVGLYTASRPEGPFRYDPRSPLLRGRGLIQGTGHHCVVEGPDGNLWVFYSVLFRNRDKFERRIAMDPVGFDASGRMVIAGPSETPQWAPGSRQRPWTGNDAGWVPVTIDKAVVASSSAPGRDPAYAVDNEVRTWWEAAIDDRAPRLTVDLGGDFELDAVRLLFSDAHLDSRRGVRPGPFQWDLALSSDGTSYRGLLDKTANTTDREVEYEAFAPARGRFLRLTVTGAPPGLPVGLLELTAFGRR